MLHLLSSTLLRSWLWFALSVLLLASVMALLLVFLKLPVLPSGWPLQNWFSRVLVLHVDLSILVWALSMVSLMWLTHLPGGARWLDSLAVWLLFGSGVGILLSIFLHQGQAVLSNYIPVLDAPLYLSSLGVFVLAVVLVAVPRLAAYQRIWNAGLLPQEMFMLALIALLATVAVQLISWLRLPELPLTLPQAELLFWGAGHSLQAVYLCALLGGWFYLLQRTGVSLAELLKPVVHRAGVWVMLAVIVVPLIISILWAPDDPRYRESFSSWMRLFSLPVLGVMSVLAYQLLWIKRRALTSCVDWRVVAVGLSMLLFLVGVLLGALIRGDSLLVPAHYHATTGAVNLVFMALVYDLVSKWLSGRELQTQLTTYAVGVVLMVSGLALSGLMGVGRKLAGSDQLLHSAPEWLAMVLMGGGGALGLFASFWFLAKTLKALTGLYNRPTRVSQLKVTGS